MNKVFGFLLFTITILLAPYTSAHAGGVVNSTTDAALRTAVESGGTVTFDFDGVITLTNALNIRANTVIDATGRSIEISGNDACRLLQVTNNISLKLIGITLRNGRAGANFNWGGGLRRGAVCEHSSGLLY